MAQIPDIKRIRAEDFPEDQRDFADRLGQIINGFSDIVIDGFKGKLDFTNLNRNLVKVNVKIDGSGKVINNPQVKFNLINGKLSGINCISATNTINPTVYPTTAPFISYTYSNGILTILNVTGLQNNSEYSLTLELIG